MFNFGTILLIVAVVFGIFYWFVLPFLRHSKETQQTESSQDDTNIVRGLDEMKVEFCSHSEEGDNLYRVREIFFEEVMKRVNDFFDVVVVTNPIAIYRGKDFHSRTRLLNTTYTGEDSIREAADEFCYELQSAGVKVIGLYQLGITVQHVRTDNPADPVIDLVNSTDFKPERGHGHILNIFRIRFANL